MPDAAGAFEALAFRYSVVMLPSLGGRLLLSAAYRRTAAIVSWTASTSSSRPITP